MLRSFMLKGISARWFCTTNNEVGITALLQQRLPSARVRVEDTSGGCGTMFNIEIHSKDFKGLTTIAQHRLVKEILKDEIPKWHGFVLNTKTTIE